MSALDAPGTVPAATDAPDRWTRWSDRLNPILVREVQQAMKGRGFVLTVFAALAISIVIAIAVAGDYDGRTNAGREAFNAGLATLVPMVLFVVPMQAYQSMRLELRGGIVEQLFLSRLRPRSILLGKLLAALVQFALYVSVMAPLLATSYLLRGVDLPTIAVSMLWALVFCITATAFAVSAAAQAVLPGLQPLANIGVAFGLGISTAGLVGLVGSGEYARDIGALMRSSEFGLVTSLIVGGGLCSTVLSGLTAQCFLMHAFENRSTGFRVFLFAMMAVAFGWMLLFIDAAHWDQALPGIVFFLCLLGSVFGIFAVTEQSTMSPRVHAHVPRHAALAAMAVPFLPGRDRGMACIMLYFVVLGLVGLLTWPVAAPGPFDFHSRVTRLCLLTVAYTMVYLTLGKAVRARLPANLMGNHVARFVLPLLLFAFCVVPFLVDVLARGAVDGWHVGHVMNPFWTIERFAMRTSSLGGEFLTPVLLTLGIALALQGPAIVRGTLEVMRASAQRRQRHAAAAGTSGRT